MAAAAAGIIMLHFYPLPAPAAACTVASFTAHNTINIGRISQHFICSVINFPAGLPGPTLYGSFSRKKFAPNQTIVHCALLRLHPGVAACCHVCGGEKLKIINRAIISSRGSGWRSFGATSGRNFSGAGIGNRCGIVDDNINHLKTANSIKI